MSVKIAPADHDDAKRMVAILEAGLAPWPAYSWEPRWPQPWVLIVDESVAAELVRRLYAADSGLAEQVAAQLPHVYTDAAPAHAAAPVAERPPVVAPVAHAAPVVAPAPDPAPVEPVAAPVAEPVAEPVAQVVAVAAPAAPVKKAAARKTQTAKS